MANRPGTGVFQKWAAENQARLKPIYRRLRSTKKIAELISRETGLPVSRKTAARILNAYGVKLRGRGGANNRRD